MNTLHEFLRKALPHVLYLGAIVLVLAWGFWPVSDEASAELAHRDQIVAPVSRSQTVKTGTMPIQSTAVGQRVLGEDPLIDDAERAGWVEPQWGQWLQISLVMRKDTGDELRIELLRPEEWLTERWQFVASRTEGWCVTALDDQPTEDATAGLTPLLEQCGTPWRAYRQEMAATALALAATGYELVGLTLALDLHEIGAVGEAMVLDIQPAPPVRLGAGRVVTGKFSHKSGDVIDLVLAAADQESETIGTTSNHPFWSEDRRDYVQAGSLEEGERVLTFAGDTKRVVSKLARPGPQPVYNLEVHGEHVYHVGKDGVLVHNSGPQYVYGSEVILDTNALKNWKNAKSAMKPGEVAVVTRQTIAEVGDLISRGTKGFTHETLDFANSFKVIDDVADVETMARMRQHLEAFSDPKFFRKVGDSFPLGGEFPSRSLIQGLDGDGIIGTTAILTQRAVITQDRAFLRALRSMGGEVRGIGPLSGQ